MRAPIFLLLVLIILNACSNSSDFESGEIKVIKSIRDVIKSKNQQSTMVDVRKIITRKKVDAAQVAVLYVELENGQNGTLTLYPGVGVGETWLGADGTTVTLEHGILKATRGLRGDLMKSSSSKPSWYQIKNSATYERDLVYLNGKNQNLTKTYSCRIQKSGLRSTIKVFDVNFQVQQYDEICFSHDEEIKNIYFLDEKHKVRKSSQYHGEALGYIKIERVDR